MSLTETLRNAGIVGAGGAGFPTYVKAGSKVEYLIANGAECEPLLHKDAHLMELHPDKIIRGMQILGEATGAKHLVVGIKEKNIHAIEAMERACAGTGIRVHRMKDYYPAGDEYELTYDITGRLIPPKGIPLDVHVVTQNVETLYNVCRAVDEGKPVTHKWITVTGAVREPKTMSVPVGISLRECIALAGGATIDDYQMSLDGIMMGKWETDIEKPITKTSGGIIVLPSDHYLITRRSRPTPKMHRIGKSACDQCSFCTELCPRYMLGYDIQPHKVMRSLGFTQMGEGMWNKYADLCCACGLCTLFACPEDLYPKEACDRAKDDLRATNQKWDGPMEVTVRPMKEARRVPLKSIMRRLKILKYEHEAPFTSDTPRPMEVAIPLKMHVGEPSQAIVRMGDRVQAGQLIAQPVEKKLGVAIHASIDGVVIGVNGAVVINAL